MHGKGEGEYQESSEDWKHGYREKDGNKLQYFKTTVMVVFTERGKQAKCRLVFDQENVIPFSGWRGLTQTANQNHQKAE
jgi:hypothetical protein